MKIFILEDSPIRVVNFMQDFLQEDLTISNNAEEAIKNLTTTKYDYIFLDHDLGGDIMVCSSEKNTGANVAKHVHVSNIDTPVVIHSWNPTGCENMKSILESKEHKGQIIIAPFDDDEFVNVIDQLCKKN